MFSFNKRRSVRSSHSPEDALIAIFEETKLFLAWPENDFSSSRWMNANIALAEINVLINALKEGRRPTALHLELLFAPSGPMQEVSLQSGWEIAFFQLADRFDHAIFDYKTVGGSYREISEYGLLPA